MNRCRFDLAVFATSFFLIASLATNPASADAGHPQGPEGGEKKLMEQMRETHSTHEHGHDFEAIERMSTEDMQRLMALMADIGLAMPPLDSHRGRELFVNRGCVVCHSVNNVGGQIGPSLNAEDMPQPMNAFEFSARMWRGAPAMAQMQEELLGAVIDLSGQDLADLVAFAHDKEEQSELTSEQIPAHLRKLIEQ